MSDQRNSVPPCWAADPTGRHRFRYWDGTTWTGHVFDGPVPPVAAPGPPPTTSFPPAAEPAPPLEPDRFPFAVQPDDEHTGAEPPGSSTRRRPEHARRAFLIGALVGGLVVAIFAAVAWVTVGDGGDSNTTVATPNTTTTSRKTTTTTLVSTTSAAVSTTVAGRPPAQVRVVVLNAAGTEGAAGSKADVLKAAGYTIADLGNAPVQKGTTVACKTGFDAEAAALTQAVGSGATTQPFPTPPPAGSENADCVVTLGT